MGVLGWAVGDCFTGFKYIYVYKDYIMGVNIYVYMGIILWALRLVEGRLFGVDCRGKM